MGVYSRGTANRLYPYCFRKYKMIRKTDVEPKTLGHDWGYLQTRLDHFWTLIENDYEEEWRIAANGDLTLEVSSEMLEQILKDNYAQSWLAFGTYSGGKTAEGKKFLVNRPEQLIGTYIIKGVYDARQRLVNGERTYFFVQGA